MRALDTLWGFYSGSAPVDIKKSWGVSAELLAKLAPRLSRSEFEVEFAPAIEQAMQRIREKLPQCSAEFLERMKTSKILCLSEVEDCILMWSHYAEQHLGVLLKFRSVPALDSAWGLAMPIRYQKETPCLFDTEFAADLIGGRASLDVHEMTDKMIYTKALDWSYEKEWRVCAGDGRSNAEFEDFQFKEPELAAVVFGCRTPKSDIEEISELVEQNYFSCTLMRARKAGDRFALEFETI